MLIGGFQKFSLIDYPGKTCAIVFTIGCNFRCSYCHNPELVYPELSPKPIPEKDIFSFLEKRKDKLDAVTVTGGEPALQPDLLDFILKIRKKGFLIKLDSNGSNPEMLEKVLSSRAVDYIAMDVKAPLEKYPAITNSGIDINKIRRSIELVMNSNINYEFRTTVAASQLDENDIIKIGQLIEGAKLYVLQKYVPAKQDNHTSCVVARFTRPVIGLDSSSPYNDEDFKKFQSVAAGLVQKCVVR